MRSSPSPRVAPGWPLSRELKLSMGKHNISGNAVFEGSQRAGLGSLQPAKHPTGTIPGGFFACFDLRFSSRSRGIVGQRHRSENRGNLFPVPSEKEQKPKG